MHICSADYVILGFNRSVFHTYFECLSYLYKLFFNQGLVRPQKKFIGSFWNNRGLANKWIMLEKLVRSCHLHQLIVSSSTTYPEFSCNNVPSSSRIINLSMKLKDSYQAISYWRHNNMTLNVQKLRQNLESTWKMNVKQQQMTK